MTNLVNPIVQVWEQREDDGVLVITHNEEKGCFISSFEPDMNNEKSVVIETHKGELAEIHNEDGDLYTIGLDLMRQKAIYWYKGRVSQYGGAKHLSITAKKDILLAGNKQFDMTWNDGGEYWELRDLDNHFANASDSADAERLAQCRLVNPNYSQFALNGWEVCDLSVGDDVIEGWMRDLPEGILYITPQSGVFDYSYTDLEGNDHKLESRRTLEEAKEGADDYYARKFG